MLAAELPGSDAIAGLRGAVDALAAQPLPHGDALEHELIEIRAQIDRLEAEFCRRLRRFDRARGFVRSGAASVVGWLRNACRMSASAAHERVEVARGLDTLPEVERAWRESRVGYHHAAVLARSGREIGHQALRANLPGLLDAAQRLDPSGLRQLTRFMRFCVAPDGARSAEDDAYGRRFVDLSQTIDGFFVFNGQLDVEGGALLRTAINSLDKPIAGDERTAGQRRADALVELAGRMLKDGTLPTTHGQRPHLVVTVPEATLRGQGTAPGEIEGAGPIAPALAQRLACDASVTEIRVDGTGSPTSASEASRVVPPALRTALGVRDRGCRFPGCDRPPDWTDAHHIRFRSHHGPTKGENLVLLCRVHHRYVHEGGWHVAWGANGALEALPP